MAFDLILKVDVKYCTSQLVGNKAALLASFSKLLVISITHEGVLIFVKVG